MTVLLACASACAADPFALVIPDAGTVATDASVGAGACTTLPSTETFEVVEGGFRRVFPAVADGCVVYQTTMFVAERPASWIAYETTMCNACAVPIALDVMYTGQPLDPPTISDQFVYSVGLGIGTRDELGATYYSGAECGGACTHYPATQAPGPVVAVRSLIAAGATEVVRQQAQELYLSVTDQARREPGGGWKVPDYFGELEGVLVYPRARSVTTSLSLATSGSWTVLCKSIGLAYRDDLDGNQRYRRGELGKVEDLYVIRSVGPLRLPEQTMQFLRSLELRPCVE